MIILIGLTAYLVAMTAVVFIGFRYLRSQIERLNDKEDRQQETRECERNAEKNL